MPSSTSPWGGPENADLAAALAGPEDRSAGLMAGAPGTGLSVRFLDGAPETATDLVPTPTGISGTAAPLEAFSTLEPTASPADGSWSVIVLNTSEVDLQILSCQLRLTTSGAPAAAVTTGTLPYTGSNPLWVAVGGTVLLGLGAALCAGRRRTAVVLTISLVAGAFAVPNPPKASAAPAAPAAAALGVTPGFVQVPIGPENPAGYETHQNVTGTGLPASSTVYLEQCEGNPPPEVGYYHVPGVPTLDPVRCGR